MRFLVGTRPEDVGCRRCVGFSNILLHSIYRVAERERALGCDVAVDDGFEACIAPEGVRNPWQVKSNNRRKKGTDAIE